MIDFKKVDSKKTRTFGWIQDSGSLKSLCDVAAIFEETNEFHKNIVNRRIPSLVKKEDSRDEMLAALSLRPICVSYKLLVGSHTTPRSLSPCNGIVQAAVRGQKRDYIGDWPADNFVRWAQAFGFISYDYASDSFTITEDGRELVKARGDDAAEKNILIRAALSYPPAYRILSLLKDPEMVMTKFELGANLGFSGEDGFVSYPLPSIVAAISQAKNFEERRDIISDWESSSDKYARTIAQWLVSLGLLKNKEKDVNVRYGSENFSAKLGGFAVTPQGQRALKNSRGNSRSPRLPKRVSYEMFATKGKDREYRRKRRALVLKYLYDNKRKMSNVGDICAYLKGFSLNETEETIKDDIGGLVNLGLEVKISETGAVLNDEICDFSIPIYKDLTEKSALSEEKERLRDRLKNISHEYLSLLDLAFDSKQNRLFEIKAMELFLNECGFSGKHLGGASRPDGVLYTTESSSEYGIIVDMKAYSKGYDLPVGQRDEMLRYIRENIRREKEINSTEWWKVFPAELKDFYFMFVSGTFTENIDKKLAQMEKIHNVAGTAMPIAAALLAADMIKGHRLTYIGFAQCIKGSVFNFENTN